MLERILFMFTSMTLFSSCTSNTPDIRALCLRDDIGNYVIKWETDPYTDGTMKLFVSDNPEVFSMSAPVGYVKINEGVTTYITNDNISRKYFLLSFNDKCFQTVGARSIVMDSVQNVRDMGGYFNSHNNKMTRWGKIFRSGELGCLSGWDSIRIDNLGIKTIIDLRSEDEIANNPLKYTKANVINIPIQLRNMESIITRIRNGETKKGDGILFLQDTYLQFISEYGEQFGEAMKVFLDKKNYPILFNCSMGKDRAGFLAAMLLAAIDIPEETIKKDYMASNDYIKINKIADLARNLNQDSQETITVLLSANEGLMDLVFKQIRKEYGSTDKYLSKGLHLTEKDRLTLKDIILY